MKRTKWFKGCKPVRVGAYERKLLDGGVVYAYWGGHFWGAYVKDVARVVAYKRVRSAFQELPWRGLQEAA